MDSRNVCHALLVALMLVAMQGCAEKQSPPNSVDGQYELFNNLFPHSLDVVRVDVYEDFTCPACQQFANDFEPALIAAYGKRVQLRKHYLVGSRSPVSAQVLYEVAHEVGLGEEAARRLFAARLDHRDSAKNATVVEKVASDMGLLASYNEASTDQTVIKKIRTAWDTEGAHITFFPSIVVENVLLTNSNPENLNTIINSLLKKPMVQVSVTRLAEGKVLVRTDQDLRDL